ncbi:MAG: hypothetical protein ACRDTC_08925 [Pseudonocardiaceae bacterium]
MVVRCSALRDGGGAAYPPRLVLVGIQDQHDRVQHRWTQSRLVGDHVGGVQIGWAGLWIRQDLDVGQHLRGERTGLGIWAVTLELQFLAGSQRFARRGQVRLCAAVGVGSRGNRACECCGGEAQQQAGPEKV